jgi:ribosomal 50S subunit-recycling heat shock protein
MRLDVFLKLSRLIHRRSLAQQFCDAGAISVNGAVAKSSKTIAVGDKIVITNADRIESFRVLDLPKSKQVSKTSASELYERI